jgi:hypothetical protein
VFEKPRRSSLTCTFTVPATIPHHPPLQVVLAVARLLGYFVERSPMWLGDSEAVSIANATAAASEDATATMVVLKGVRALGRAAADPMTWYVSVHAHLLKLEMTMPICPLALLPVTGTP